MPIAFRASTTAATSSSALTLDITIPATAQVGDLCIVFYNNQTNITWNATPSGWTKLGEQSDNTYDSVVLWKILASGDPGSTLTYGSSTSNQMSALAVCYSGVASTPITGTEWSSKAQQGEATYTTNPISTAGTRWLVALFGVRANSTWTVGSGFTTRAGPAVSGGASPTDVYAEDSNGDRTAAAYTASATPSTTSNNGVSWIIALTPVTATNVSAGAPTPAFTAPSASIDIKTSTIGVAAAALGPAPNASATIGATSGAPAVVVTANNATIVSLDSTMVSAQVATASTSAQDATVDTFTPPQYYGKGYTRGYITTEPATSASASPPGIPVVASSPASIDVVFGASHAQGAITTFDATTTSAKDQNYGEGYTGGYPPFVATTGVPADDVVVSIGAQNPSVSTTFGATEASPGLTVSSTGVQLGAVAEGPAFTTAASDTVISLSATPVTTVAPVSVDNPSTGIQGTAGSSSVSTDAQPSQGGISPNSGNPQVSIAANDGGGQLAIGAATAASVVAAADTGSSSSVLIPTEYAGLSAEALSVVFAVPTGLTAVAVSPSQIDLAWDTVAWAYSYDIERDDAVIAADWVGTTFSDTGLGTGSTHRYRVRAVATIP